MEFLSNAKLGSVFMPEPIFYHIDVNSAFLSFEAAYRVNVLGEKLDIRNIPSVIGGNEERRHGIVLAKSMPAKKYKIQTGESLMEARKKCPSLAVYPPNYAMYVESSRKFIELLRRYAPIVEQYSIDEAFCDMTGTEGLYGSPVIFANELKDIIHTELGFTVNIGISNNKLLAKMASDFKKPNLVHTLFPWEIKDKMWSLPVGDLFYVGRATERKLKSLGIMTIGDLAQADPKLLESHLKSHGLVIWNYANGNDLDIEITHNAINKGYGNSLTIHHDVTDPNEAKMILLSLCETVGARIRADNAYISVVSVSIVDYNFYHVSQQMTLNSATDITEKIYVAACTVFDRLWNHSPIRQLGVHTSKATSTSAYQYSLFDTQDVDKLSKLNTAIDDIRLRYGEDSIIRACFLNSSHSHMSGGIDKAKRTGITKEV